MNVLVWQWGRRGAGPRIAALLAKGFADLPNVRAELALSAGAEILSAPDAPHCTMTLPLYANAGQLAVRIVSAPLFVPQMASRLRRMRLDLAVCAMPGPLDLMMAAALRLAGVRFAVIVHDAMAHPGDGYPLQYRLNHALTRRAGTVVVMTSHVEEALRAQRVLREGARIVRAPLPPLAFQPPAPPAPADGRMHVLSFGRLLPYKGLDLLANALRLMGPRSDFVVRIVGQGPESTELAELRALPGVAVENRWVPEAELGDLIAWANLVVLPYREASQSGVATAALAQGKRVLATNVGGLVEQLGREPLATLCAPEPASIAQSLRTLLEEKAVAAEAPPREIAAEWRDFARAILLPRSR